MQCERVGDWCDRREKKHRNAAVFDRPPANKKQQHFVVHHPVRRDFPCSMCSTVSVDRLENLYHTSYTITSHDMRINYMPFISVFTTESRGGTKRVSRSTHLDKSERERCRPNVLLFCWLFRTLHTQGRGVGCMRVCNECYSALGGGGYVGAIKTGIRASKKSGSSIFWCRCQ